MKKVSAYCLAGVILISGAFWGCSDKKEAGPEKGAIQQMTEETAKEAVERIRTPIDKARSVVKQQEEKNKEMVDAVNKQ